MSHDSREIDPPGQGRAGGERRAGGRGGPDLRGDAAPRPAARAGEGRSGYSELVEAIRRVHADPRPGAMPRGHAASADPEVTVSMPARNAARFIAPALRSVLDQEDVAVEVVVVDDASDDDTAAVAASLGDPRVRVLSNEARRGIGACHNRVLDAGAAPFVAHVDADDLIVPGALARMVEALRASPDAAQAYCNHYLVPEECSLSAREFERQRESLARLRRLIPDYRRGLIVHGMVTNTLRTYRRAALEAVGRFNEDLPWAVDYEMSVRLAHEHELVLVPEFLYVQRVHGGNTQQRLRLRALRSWRVRASICREQLRRNDGRLLGRSTPAVYGLLGVGLARVVVGTVTGSGERG